jgi:hypothetical protein
MLDTGTTSVCEIHEVLNQVCMVAKIWNVVHWFWHVATNIHGKPPASILRADMEMQATG